MSSAQNPNVSPMAQLPKTMTPAECRQWALDECAKLPEEEQQKVVDLVLSLLAQVNAQGPNGVLALTYVVAEISIRGAVSAGKLGAQS